MAAENLGEDKLDYFDKYLCVIFTGTILSDLFIQNNVTRKLGVKSMYIKCTVG
jgi:hypothetical protein